MNKYFKRLAFACTVVLVLFGMATTPACHKDKPCKAVITVLDASNNPVGGATVHLTAPAPSTTDFATSTDASGKASYTVNLPQILDISVVVGTSTYVTGKVVRFEEGKTDMVTVNI